MTLNPPSSLLSETADARQAGIPPTPTALHWAERVPASAQAPQSVWARSWPEPGPAEQATVSGE
jgi:hypothetical protein